MITRYSAGSSTGVRLLMKDIVARQASGDFDYRHNVSADCSEIIGYPRHSSATDAGQRAVPL